MTRFSERFTMLQAVKFSLVLLTLQACQPSTESEMKKKSFEPRNSNPQIGNPQRESVAISSLDQILGRWVFVTLNGAPVVVAEDDGKEEEAYVEFTEPCYEVGDGHCNEALDGSWEPSERRLGRLGFKGYSGCNWFGSEAILEEARLVAKPVMTTQRGCAGVIPQEIEIQKILSETPSLNLGGDTLAIASAAGDSLVAVRSSKLESMAN